MDVPLGEVVHFDGRTHNPTTGALADADSTPTFAVYEEDTDTALGVSGNMTKRTSLTGRYRGSFTASSGNGFEVGKYYTVEGNATVGGVAGSSVLAYFRIVPAELVAGVPIIDIGYWLGIAPLAMTSQRPNVRVGAQLATGVIDSTSFAAGAINAAAIASDAITAAKIASDALTAAKFAADFLTAAKIAADVATELQSGLATAASLATLQAAIDVLSERSNVLYGSAQGAGTGSDTLQLEAGQVTADDEIDGISIISNPCYVAIVEGTGRGLRRPIISADLSDNEIQVAFGNWTVDNTTKYIISFN